jgi:hypothetical protein
MIARIVPTLINPADINVVAKLDILPRRLFLRMMTPSVPGRRPFCWKAVRRRSAAVAAQMR